MKGKIDPSWLEVEGNDPIRLISLSDGVFATVLTLLVLDLKLPDLVQSIQAGPIHLMVELFPHIYSYFLTFLVAGTYWLAHHRVFNRIIRYDRNLLWYNLMFLLFVGLLPFTTAAYSSSGQESTFVYVIYAADIFFIGIMLSLTWGYARVHQMTKPNLPEKVARFELYRNLITPAIALASAGAAYVIPQPGLAQLAYLLIPVFTRVLSSIMFKNESIQPNATSFLASLLWRIGSAIPLIILVVWTTWFLSHR